MRILKSAHTVILLITSVFCLGAKPYKTPVAEKDTVKIGLLVQDNNSREARLACELAIRQRNREGGVNGKPVQLIVRSMEGPWGTGSKQTVDLVFSEDVLAIVGSHDGRNAHLAEQVITKTQTPFVSAWATDPTLTQAFVPWFFNLASNDKQQAALLYNEIYQRKNYKNVVIVNSTSYDSRMASDWLLKEIKNNGNPNQPAQLTFEEDHYNSSQLVTKIKTLKSDCIVLFGTPKSSLKIVQSVREAKLNQPVYGSLSMLGENDKNHFNPNDLEGVYIVDPGFLTNKQGKEFSGKFMAEYGWKPGAVAAFAYDAVNLILKAVEKSGSEQSKIKDIIQQTNFDGVTGPVSFDKNGNRIGSNGFILIKDGLISPVEK